MDSPGQYMNIVYKPCGVRRTHPSMDDLPHASGDKPLYARDSKQRLTAG